MTRSRLLPLGAVFALAATARIWVLFSRGSALDAASYDQSVYYAAAAALVHGRFPYHGDFVFVHPPVVALVGTPFAALARMTNDAVGFVAENVAFAVMGAVNAVLVVVVARAWGLSRGALAAGLVYAMWPVAFLAESTARLEPLGNLFFLLFLWAFARGRSGETRPLVLAGVFLAVLVNVKLWWCVPAFAVVALSTLAARRARVLAVPAMAAAVTGLVLDLPFLLVAGPRMIRSIVTAQLNRPDRQWTPGGHFVRLSVGQRLEQLTGASPTLGGLGRATTSGDVLATGVVAVVLVAFVVTAALACRSAVGRVFVVVLLAQAAILLAAPVYYPYYGAYVAVTAALVIAAAADQRRTGRRLVAAPGWALAAGFAGVVTLGGLGTGTGGRPVDWESLRGDTASLRCVEADSPYVLIRLDALDRGLGHGCRNVVDFQGVSYGAGPDPRAKASLRSSTPEYRRFVTDYLTSGDAVVLRNYDVRVRLGRDAVHRIDQGPVLTRSGNVVVRRVTPSPTGP